LESLNALCETAKHVKKQQVQVARLVGKCQLRVTVLAEDANDPKFAFLLQIHRVSKYFDILKSEIAKAQEFIAKFTGASIADFVREVFRSGSDKFEKLEHSLVSETQDYEIVRSRAIEKSRHFANKIEERTAKMESSQKRAARRLSLHRLMDASEQRADSLKGELRIARAAAKVEREKEAAILDMKDPIGTLRHKRALPFGDKLRQKQAEFHRGTRKWAFVALRRWLAKDLPDDDSKEKLFWLKGGAGTGKTAWSAEVVRKFGRRLAAVHLCVHNDTALSDPARMLISIAAQLCQTIDGFEAKLGEINDHKEKLHALITEPETLRDLFIGLIKAPLEALAANGEEKRKVRFILVDALDECGADNGEQNALLDIIAVNFPSLPTWMRLVVTSRELPNIREKLERRFTPKSLNCNDHKANKCDAQDYLKHMLKDKVDDVDGAVELMMDKCSVTMTQVCDHFGAVGLKGYAKKKKL
jgi:hypothetical protein